MSKQTSKSSVKAKGEPAKPAELFAFGRDKSGKLAGARFPECKDNIVNAIFEMGLRFVYPASAEFAKLGQKLPLGRVYTSGKAFIPNIKQSVFDELWQASQKETETGNVFEKKLEAEAGQAASDQPVACVSPAIAGLPRSWVDVGVGHMVLIQSSPDEGWWEAVVEAREHDVLTLRYRDYPKEKPFVRHVSTVALVNPGPV